MMLYSFKFEPFLRPMIWGGNEICKFKQIEPVKSGIGESWEIADFENKQSVISDGPLQGKTLHDLMIQFGAQLVGEHVFARFGNRFPLLIKFIDACNDLSIQVHPDDKLARERHNSFGKTEMWYVINSREGAGLYSGFSKQITPEEYVERVEKNTFMDVLQRYETKPGDLFFLPAGRVHAIGSGLFIAEIQQTSDVTYRIYDYNRMDKDGHLRELHTKEAMDAIDYTVLPTYKSEYVSKKDEAVELVECPYFHTNLLDLTKEYQRNVEELDSFVIYICSEGKATITDQNGYTIVINRGETVLIPASTKDITVMPQENTKILEVYIPRL